MLKIAFIIFCFVSSLQPFAFAQDNDLENDFASESEVDMFEKEIQTSTNKPKKQVAPLVKDKEEPVSFSSLTDLAPFSDVSIIKKKYLSRTERFQAFGGFTGIVNDPWFSGLGLDGKFAYHFTEAWGLELNYFILSTSERAAAKELHDEHGIEPSSLVTVKNYSGIHLTWTPLYGKMSLSNHRIIPFDILFSAGFGSSKVDHGEGGSTLHFGTGQVFALTKAQAFRWDITWNVVSARPINKPTQTFNNISITAGYSFFFPEAKYR